MFYGCLVSNQKPVEVIINDTSQMIHLTSASLTKDSDQGRFKQEKTSLIIQVDNKIYTLCNFLKDKREKTLLDIYIFGNQNVKLKVIGKGEIDVCGYLETKLDFGNQFLGKNFVEEQPNKIGKISKNSLQNNLKKIHRKLKENIQKRSDQSNKKSQFSEKCQGKDNLKEFQKESILEGTKEFPDQNSVSNKDLRKIKQKTQNKYNLEEAQPEKKLKTEIKDGNKGLVLTKSYKEKNLDSVKNEDKLITKIENLKGKNQKKFNADINLKSKDTHKNKNKNKNKDQQKVIYPLEDQNIKTKEKAPKNLNKNEKRIVDNICFGNDDLNIRKEDTFHENLIQKERSEKLKNKKLKKLK